MANIDSIFTHVESAVEALNTGTAEGHDKALRMLELVRGLIAVEAIKHTDADVGSQHYYDILDVVLEKYPREVDE
jgi:hypothetical protein